jgi:acetoin utilization protein AcuB
MDYANQRVADWMTGDPLTTTPDFSASEAYERMRQRGVRRMPVLNAQSVLVGIITRSDIEAAVALPRDEEGWRSARFALAGTTVADLMTADPMTVAADDPIAAAAAAMIQARVSGLPVLRDGRLVGIITESDIFRLVAAGWSKD